MKSREETLRSIASQSFDVCVIGGGATGAGCALDAQLRGLPNITWSTARCANAF